MPSIFPNVSLKAMEDIFQVTYDRLYCVIWYQKQGTIHDLTYIAKVILLMKRNYSKKLF